MKKCADLLATRWRTIDAFLDAPPGDERRPSVLVTVKGPPARRVRLSDLEAPSLAVLAEVNERAYGETEMFGARSCARVVVRMLTAVYNRGCAEEAAGYTVRRRRPDR